MKSRGIATPSWRILLLTMAMMLWSAGILAKEDPKLSITKFDHPPLNLRYFEDSDSIVFQDIEERNVYWSDNAGSSWQRAKGIPDGKAFILIMHRFDPKTAFVLTDGWEHYKTHDRGASWSKWKSGTLASAWQPEILNFHADDPKRIIFNGMRCDGIFCNDEAVYTIDGFENVELLRSLTNGCWWARSSKEFTTGQEDLDQKRTMCIVKDDFSLFKEQQRLYISDSFFAVSDDRSKYDEFEPKMAGDRAVDGIVNLVVVKKYLLVASSSPNSDEMALYVSDDTITWHRAMFPTDDSHDHSHQINQAGYTVLESTNYSIQVDVSTSKPSHPMGVLFTSNSNGTFFTENIPYTNRNHLGNVDFELISGIQGVYMVNVVENGPEVEKSGAKKKVVTKITFDDGRTFESIKAGDDLVHLHSETEPDNVGRIFSSPAPGLVMGNGNTGKSLASLSESNLYVSDNAGLTWKKALDGPHKYEFGDSGSILLAVKDSRHEDVKEFSYSLDHGDKWESVKLPDDLSIKPDYLTTTQDSTSLKFLLLGEQKGIFHMVSIDFESLKGRTCKSDDMEDWHARLDKDDKPTCIMGHRETYQRRKKTADCFIRSEFKDPVLKTEDCECSDADFECDYNFQRDPDDNKVCKNVGPIARPDGVCKNPEDTFEGTSGWRLIPGNTCKRGKGPQKDDEVERKCSDAVSAPSQPGSSEVSSKQFVFDDVKLQDFQMIYLERSASSAGDDETIIARPAAPEGDGRMRIENKIWLTHNHGKDWKRILEGEEIKGIYPHLYFQDVVFFTTPSDKVVYSIDRGHSFHTFKAPTSPGDGFPLSFHPDKKDWLIWVGEACETVGGVKSCFPQASISTDRGDNWETFLRYAKRCEFTGHSAYTFRPLDQIVCLAPKEEKDKSPLTVVTIEDFSWDNKLFFHGEVKNFATMSEFIVLAGQDSETGNLRAYASLDGHHWEPAHFPHNFHEGHENEYTVLDSSTHAINLFVETSAGQEMEMHYGSIVKSNSNGTSYVVSASNVNANALSYVDYEKVPGIEGIAIINVVSNADKHEKTKDLQTKISHNDGAEWGYLAPPSKDVDGNSYKCGSSRGDNSCALHFHHYTERDDKRRTFASATAVGLILGVGNVGPKLGPIKDADTFLSTDGGITWKNVKKGHWTWQYGDQGSIIVLVQRATSKTAYKTNSISYSVDEGQTWTDYQFTDSEVTVLDITTMKSGTSRNFLLWCKSDKGVFTVNLDFTGLADSPCQLKDNEHDSDYVLWSPKHPLQNDDCLFGHVAKYLRKKPERKCYNEQNLQRLHEYSDCECSRRDYECAYNYEMDNHGQCSLVQGLNPLSGQDWCKQHPNETSWFEPTGYRKIPLSTCKGGVELDKTSTEHPCDGYEEEFERKHRTSGLAILLSIIIPFGLAGVIGTYVYRNWNGKFGQIRLGENTSTFDSDQPWIKYPVIVVSAVAAVVAAMPLLMSSLWRSAVGTYERIGGGTGSGRDGSWFSSGPRRFTTRDSFSRGRGDYSVVDDEGELLGEDSDEEI